MLMLMKYLKIFCLRQGVDSIWRKPMKSFKDFIQKYKLENKPTSNTNIQQVLSSLSLKDVGIYLRDGPFSSDIGIVNLHSPKGTH